MDSGTDRRLNNGQDIPDVWFFFEALGRFNRKFPKLFGGDSEEDDGGNGKGGNGFNQQWGWFVVIDNLANGDATKWDGIIDWDIVKALNIITYYKSKQEYENFLIRANGK